MLAGGHSHVRYARGRTLPNLQQQQQRNDGTGPTGATDAVNPPSDIVIIPPPSYSQMPSDYFMTIAGCPGSHPPNIHTSSNESSNGGGGHMANGGISLPGTPLVASRNRTRRWDVRETHMVEFRVLSMVKRTRKHHIRWGRIFKGLDYLAIGLGLICMMFFNLTMFIWSKDRSDDESQWIELFLLANGSAASFFIARNFDPQTRSSMHNKIADSMELLEIDIHRELAQAMHGMDGYLYTDMIRRKISKIEDAIENSYFPKKVVPLFEEKTVADNATQQPSPPQQGQQQQPTTMAQP